MALVINDDDNNEWMYISRPLGHMASVDPIYTTDFS